jgi:hypothetical protein
MNVFSVYDYSVIRYLLFINVQCNREHDRIKQSSVENLQETACLVRFEAQAVRGLPVSHSCYKEKTEERGNGRKLLEAG